MGRKKRGVIFAIKDTGIGIPEEDRECIFYDFYRSKNAKKIIEKGTGLGLSIAKEVVSLHGGEIRVETEEDKGSTFEVKLYK
ncbi:MAG: hypothetical protein DRP87_04170 [Spirochaetes bacterium]|nr:MAG: hypothetical protein DRP87_04170 [Spirochaetota bacterium]